MPCSRVKMEKRYTERKLKLFDINYKKKYPTKINAIMMEKKRECCDNEHKNSRSNRGAWL